MIHPPIRSHIILKYGELGTALLKNWVSRISEIMDVDEDVIIERLFG